MRIHGATLFGTVAVALALTASGCRTETKAQQQTTAAFDLEEATIRALIQDQQAGRRTARQMASAYIARIQALDRSGPTVRAVIELNPDALTVADSLDADRSAGRLRGPLHGIPVLIKDNIDTADHIDHNGWLTRAGRLDRRPRRLHRRTAARRGRSASWQDEHERVGEFPILSLDERLERPRRPGQESLRARPEPLWIELGDRRGHRREFRDCRRRHGDRRLDHLSLGSNVAGRHQTDARSREPVRHHPDCAFAGYRRTDGENR